MRGINKITKFHEICATLSAFQTKMDVIVLGEVQLKTRFPINLYNLAGFQRYESLRPERGGGGVICFIRDTINVEESETKTDEFEKIKLILNTNGSKYKMIAYYRAPATNISKFLMMSRTN